MKRLVIVLLCAALAGATVTVGVRFLVSRAIEHRGVQKLISQKTARLLDCDGAYLPVRSNGLFVVSDGFLGKATPPRTLTELRAAHLRAHCQLGELWKGHWRIDTVSVAHLQAGYGAAAAQHLVRGEFADPPLLPPSPNDSPIEVDIGALDIARTDLYWGTTPEAGGQFRDVHTTFYPRDKNLVIHGSNGAFQQAKWPAARVQTLKLFYAKPDLRVDEASLTLGGASLISVLGNFRFAGRPSLDLQLTFAQCPLAPFLNEEQRSRIDGTFQATAHLQKDETQTESARAAGRIAFDKLVLRKIEMLRKVAAFTGREELAHLPVNELKADYDWNYPELQVKNFSLVAKGIGALKGDFSLKENKLSGEFEIGLAPDLVDKFPGAREEVFTKSDGGLLWTGLTVTGSPENIRDNLRPRLVRAAQDYFAKGILAPIFKPGREVLQTLESL